MKRDDAVGSWTVDIPEVQARRVEVFGISKYDAIENAKAGWGTEIGEPEFRRVLSENIDADKNQSMHFRIQEVYT